MRLKSMLAAGAAVIAMGASAPAFADIEILAQNCASCSNVALFDDSNTTDFLMHGSTTGGQAVLFTGIETLADTGPGMGVAWVGAADGSLTYLDISIEDGFTFTDLGFNLNEPNLPRNPDWYITITGVEDNGAETSQNFTLNNNTMFHIRAYNGQVMKNVRIQQLASAGGSPLDEDAASALDGVGQIKIGGVAAVVPEPATWGLMITGFAGMGAMLRRRRAQLALA